MIVENGESTKVQVVRIPELLAPAGSIESLYAAVSAGADAVYLGLESFNARRNANNFTIGNLKEACDYAHLRGVRVYVTMNIIILPNEIDEAFELAKEASAAGADGLIIQDIGLAMLVSKHLPDVELHLSTQMNIHDSYGIRAAYALGAKRVTLSRELSISEIADLTALANELGIEVEVFAHGALCVCYSGQCFMSSMIGGRSANRGLCAQACRLPYTLQNGGHADRELDAPGEFLLSPKDLCSIDHLQQLIDAGVSSLKIEGRMKSPEYVMSVVSVYRSVLNAIAAVRATIEGSGVQSNEVGNADARASVVSDSPSPTSVEPTQKDRERLASVFSRGFTPAYLEGIRDNGMMSYTRPNNRGQFVGRVKSIKDGMLKLTSEIDLSQNDLLEIWTRKGNVTVEVPSDFEQDRRSVTIRFSEPLRGVREGDRVFRIRSAQAAFDGDERFPKVPVVGSVTIKKDEPIAISFRLAEPEEVEKSDSRLEDPSISILISNRLKSLGSISAIAEGVVVEAARSKAITIDEVIEHVNRIGNTPFEICSIEVELDEGVGLGYSQIHRTRADALDALQEAILQESANASRNASRAMQSTHASHAEVAATDTSRAEDRHAASNEASTTQLPSTDQGEAVPMIAVLSTNPDCARAAKRAGADEIYIPALNYRRGQSQTAGVLDGEAHQASFPKQYIIAMPVVDHDISAVSENGNAPNRESKIGFDVWEYAKPGNNILVESLSESVHAVSLGCIPEIGQHLPITNSASIDVAVAFGCAKIWLSPELNIHQIKDLALYARKVGCDLGVKIAGAQELMTTEHCLLMSQGSCSESCLDCSRRKAPHNLKDRLGYEFPVITDMFGRSHLMNSVELDNVAALPELIEAGITDFMIDSTMMNAEQTAQATGRLKHAIQVYGETREAVAKLPNTTTGHMFRGVA